jgi:hypothetical protein
MDRDCTTEYMVTGWILVIVGFWLLYLYYEKGGHKLVFPFTAVTPF